jgi:hypothetical protein
MGTPKIIPPLAPSKLNTLRLGKLMTMDEHFDIIGKLFEGYIGPYVKLLEDIEPCSTIAEATRVLAGFENDEWLDEMPTIEMLESKVISIVS